MTKISKRESEILSFIRANGETTYPAIQKQFLKKTNKLTIDCCIYDLMSKGKIWSYDRDPTKFMAVKDRR